MKTPVSVNSVFRRVLSDITNTPQLQSGQSSNNNVSTICNEGTTPQSKYELQFAHNARSQSIRRQTSPSPFEKTWTNQASQESGLTTPFTPNRPANQTDYDITAGNQTDFNSVNRKENYSHNDGNLTRPHGQHGGVILDSDEDSEFQDYYDQSEDYVDDGDPDYTCEHCGAIFWYGERLNKRRNAKNPKFAACCMQGQITLPSLKESPELLWQLLTGDDELARNFKDNIRAYNMIFSFTSIGGRVDHCVPKGRGPQMFALQGENYHLMGALKPKPGELAKFLQLYIIDTANEVENRMNIMSNGKDPDNGQGKKKFRKEIIESIIKLLNQINPHVDAFRSARDRFNTNDEERFHMRIIAKRTTGGRLYNMPTASEVAALIPGDFHEDMDKRDIVLQEHSGKLKRIHELHVAYLALQYPLLFPYGEDGYRLGIKKLKTSGRGEKEQEDVSMRQFFAYRLHERENEKHVLVRSKRLLQQFVVDAFTMIESNRLHFIRKNQIKFRTTNLESVQKAASSGNNDLQNQGKRVTLQASFTGGPRYMTKNYLDAMAICKHFGFPNLFITFTCNPKWPEIVRFCKKCNLKPDDRPDIICRVFKMKLDRLMDDLTVKHILGKMVSDIDKIISVEIPDKVKKPELYQVVKDCMIHGPCGAANPNSPCIVDGICTKFFPKSFNNTTKVDKEGFPVYKRRKNGGYIEKIGFKCDNRYVIPYNEKLSLHYRAHINVEWCNQSGSIKYLFKYIHKGHDRVTVTVEPHKKDGDVEMNVNGGATTKEKEIDEVQDYFDCRYVLACEAMWRIFKFPIHHKTTPVVKLTFHEEGLQLVVIKEGETIEAVMERLGNQMTPFLAWFELNKKNLKSFNRSNGKKRIKKVADPKKLLYEEIPNHFTWNNKEKKFALRERGFAISRINFVPRAIEDSYFLRILLNIRRGPQQHKDLKTVDGVVYNSYRDAVFALGLLDDDKEYINGIKEANFWCSAKYVRRLFVIMLLSASLSKPEIVWEESWKILSEDIERKKRHEWNQPDLILSDEDKKKFALQEIEKLLIRNAASLTKWKQMPQVDMEEVEKSNQFLLDELKHNNPDLKAKHDEWLSMATSEQKQIYTEIVDAVYKDRVGAFFVYGFGGTGKTFLWKLLSAAIRYRGDIALNVASSGIAALLLDGGRTAHSRFGIPINPHESSVCNIARGTDLGELIEKAKLIIWDEAPMMSKYWFESLDRSLRDIMNKEDKPFGGKVIVFGGDFRQVLSVINGAGRE
ncbi:PREDICTED: uncharacterized protein LOC104759705 [Camelina sativa]|uniref:ATP-dependent DNA helicase n=1 Tax=Camelina sativa TaxID=90675 RepID=A0ABM0X587_CAMSA|nr:PREDICTED: uncharacterized protein LOC104759705 [Camelina sativa]